MSDGKKTTDETTGGENEVILDQIIITRSVRGDDVMISTEFSENMSVGNGLMMLEYGRMEMYANSFFGPDHRDEDDEDDD